MRVFFVISFIGLAIIIFSTCKKEDTGKSEYPDVYHKINKGETGPLRAFTLSGEIKTKAIIDRFASLDTLFFSGYLTNTLFDNRAYIDSIKMTGRGSAEILNNYSYSKYVINTRSKNIFFTGKDTTTYVSFGEVFTHSLPYHMSLYKPIVFNEYLFSSTAGNYQFGYTANAEFVFIKPDKLLKAPLLIYTVHNTGYSNIYFIHNKLNPGFFKWLNPGDTVAVKEYYISYGK